MSAVRFLPPPPAPDRDVLRARAQAFGRSWLGRVVLVACFIAALDHRELPLPALLTIPAWIIVGIAAIWSGLRLLGWFLRRLLWRIRTKLLLSYLFIAVVPLILGSLLVLLAGILFSGLVGAQLVSDEVARTADVVRATAGAAWDGLPSGEAAGPELDRRLQAARRSYPKLAYALVRAGHLVASSGTAAHELPGWMEADSFGALVLDGENEVVRGVHRAGPGEFLVLDVPLDEQMISGLKARTGIRILTSGGRVRAEETERGLNVQVDGAPRRHFEGRKPNIGGMAFIAPTDRIDWATGKHDLDPLTFSFLPWELLRRLSPAGSLNVAELLVKVLAVVGVVFMAMYLVALLLGFGLARSITKSVHALTVGTLRLRMGEFDRPIPIDSRDQLGELAESFNMMSRGIQDLLREQAEKERLEEELRIARQIQMKLLPQGAVTFPGLRLAAVCLPATEVGGDYYDLLPLSATRMGVLVADVSGKGTSAALYMAELKGLVLSLSRMYESPRRLLSEANRILAANMDSRTFITMTYAVIDVEARTMRFARAGHNPVIQFETGTGVTRVLTPPGMGLGLDRGDRFDQVMEEAEVPLCPGDVFLFYTDGLSEAMNPRSELFGEDRLREVVRSSEAMGSEVIKERILGEIRTFVAGAAQHDDMTMVIVKID